jgi:acetoacetyl-CoA synthetase
MGTRTRLHHLKITVNQKKVELPVKQIVSGYPVQSSGTLLNPQSLNYFRQFAQVEKLGSGSSKL